MAGVHLITGEDDFKVSETAKKLIADAGSVETIDSAASSNAERQLEDVARARESYATPPFLEPSKATWWKNVWFLPRSGGRKSGDGAEQRLSADVKAALESFANFMASSPLPGNQTFVITAPGVLATSVFYKTLKGVAQIAAFAEEKPREKAESAKAFAVETAEADGLKFESDAAAAAFVAIAGTDSRTIRSEISKMRDYLGDGETTIRAADIEAITSRGPGEETGVWRLAEAVAARNAGAAAAAVKALEADGGFAVVATNTLERLFRQLAALKDAAAKGKSDEAAAAMGMQPWLARKNTGFAAKWTMAELRAARVRFMALREKVVSSSGGADAMVLVEVLRACRPRGGR
jgi:DNA polymerase III delta subunit